VKPSTSSFDSFLELKAQNHGLLSHQSKQKLWSHFSFLLAGSSRPLLLAAADMQML
jgi:hypothetical protein